MFHLSLPVDDLKACEEFYREAFGATVQGLREGVSNIHVFGAQLTLHERAGSAMNAGARDEMHFGQVVSAAEWTHIHDRLTARGLQLVHCAMPDAAQGRRGKMLVRDPSGNLVEINSRV